MFLLAILQGQNGASAEDRFAAIPYSLEVASDGGVVKIHAKQIDIVAFQGTDVFTDVFGTIQASAVPNVMFTPSGDFSLSAKVQVTLNEPYSGAGFLIKQDKSHWAKVIVERFKAGGVGVASTVVRQHGDDAYHGVVQAEFVYLKLTRISNAYLLQTSSDGEAWDYKRSFSFGNTGEVNVGFMAQSPIAEEATAIFSEIVFDSAMETKK
jgi:hypothetical protein